MPLSKKRLLKELVRAAFEFHGQRPWEEFLNEDVVALRIPGQEHPAIVSILGAAGEEFGLSVFLGERAAGKLLDTFSEEMTTEETFEDDHLVAFTMSPLGDLVPWARDLLELAGYRGRREAPAPWFMSKHPGRQPRRPDRDHLEILLFAVRGFLDARERGLVEPTPLEPGIDHPLLVLLGDARNPEVTLDRLTFRPAPAAAPVEFDVPREVDDLPRRETEWQVGFPILPASIKGSDATLRAVVVYDPQRKLVLGARTMEASDAGRGFFEIALSPMPEEVEAHLPRRVVFRQATLCRLLEPSLAKLGIEVGIDPELHDLDALTDEICGTLLGGDLQVPVPDDLGGWKEADRVFTSRIVEYVGDRMRDPRALAEFFGSEKAGLKLLRGRFDEGTGPAYFEWLLSHYRPAPLEPPYGVRLLHSGRLPPVERILLRNRLRSRVGIYRIHETGPDGRVLLVDVLDGSEYVIRDFSVAENEAGIDSCVAMQLCRAGDFRFASILGPGLNRDSIDEGLDFLERQMSPLTPETLAERPEALGRLWSFVERAAGKPPPELRLVNSERHAVSMRETTFAVESAPAVAEALLAQDEFERDGSDMVWVRHLEEAGPMGPGRILRGRLRSSRNGVVAETNSRERMAELRGIIERLPGVRAGDEKDVSPPELRRSPRRGGKVKEVVLDFYFGEGHDMATAEAALVERTRKHYLEWVDSKIPALDGRSPRELVETEAGRRRIRRRIFAMGRPPGLRDLGEDLPREEMLRSLGLADEPTGT